jgi:hypothetical protein
MALNSNFTAGQILTAVQQNNFPRGVAGYQNRTTNFTANTGAADIGVSVTFTAVSTRIYKTTLNIPLIDSGAAQILIASIADNASATLVGGQVSFTASLQRGNLTLQLIETGISGSTVRKGRAETTTGSATFSGAPIRASIVVEDIGLA